MVVGDDDFYSEPAEQLIDFTLATPSTLNLPQAVKEQEEEKTEANTSSSRPVIIARKVTMI